MTDYKKIQAACEQDQKLVNSLVDEFLIYYAADHDNLERKMNKELAKYRHVTSKFQKSWLNMMKGQYLAHKVFQNGGRINKYINHRGLDHLNKEEKEYLQFQIDHPWRFNFSEIIDRPADNFFEMVDVFSGETYLLYSQGMSSILLSQNVSLWFNLISYNGVCWQTYGPIGAYRGFEPDDIVFFASQLSFRGWVEEDKITDDVEKNPVPYMMLLSGANLPQVVHDDDILVQITAEYLDDYFETDTFRDDFKIEYADGIYRLSLNEWDEYPHYATLYYEEKNNQLFLYAMTDIGFDTLVESLNSYGYEISDIPDFRVGLSMVTTAQDILNKRIQVNEYGDLFTVDPSEGEKKELDKFNRFLEHLIPDINAGKRPDIENLAPKYDIDIETAKDLVQQLRNKLDGS